MTQPFDHIAWFREHGSGIVSNVLGAEKPSGPVILRKLVDQPGRAVVELDFGVKRAVAKVFGKESEEARNACEREVYALVTLRDLGLVPQLYTYSDTNAYLVYEFIEGESLDSALTEASLAGWARKLGAWSARYIVPQPRRTLEIDWFDYMAQYGGIITDDNRDDARARFAGQPVQSFALAKNDMDLTNFIVRPNGDLAGIDFERSRFKPLGWDLVATAWTLLTRYPEREAEFAEPLFAGWDESASQPLTADFKDAALFFARRAATLKWQRMPYKP